MYHHNKAQRSITLQHRKTLTTVENDKKNTSSTEIFSSENSLPYSWSINYWVLGNLVHFCNDIQLNPSINLNALSAALKMKVFSTLRTPSILKKIYQNEYGTMTTFLKIEAFSEWFKTKSLTQNKFLTLLKYIFSVLFSLA